MYVIKPCSNTDSTLTMSANSFNWLELAENKTTWKVKFGVKTCEAEVEISDQVDDNNMILSNNMLKKLGMPLTCEYEVMIQNGEIIIGPFIGLLTETTNKRVARMLPTYKSFIKGYKHIGGAIIVFSLEGICIEDETISGFLYQPGEGTWVFGTFPYPTAVMSILEASLTTSWKEFNEKLKHLISVLGPTVFNYPHFSKLEMHEILSPKLAHVLPETILYNELDDIREMLLTFRCLYIKPLYGRLGRYIFKVIKERSRIVVQYIYKGTKQIKYFTNDDEINAFFKKHLVPKMFLIQEMVPIMGYENRVIDFRVMMVKNEFGIWENVGFYSRYGAEGAIISNITAGGHTELAASTLQNVWDLSNEEIDRITEKIDHVVRESLDILEQKGFHLGNVGFDIGLDENCNLYIIEINHQHPDPYIALKANNKRGLYFVRLKNMLYAKHLAGYE